MLMNLEKEQQEQSRRNAILEAVGMCKMSGAIPSKDFYTLMEWYIHGEKTLDEIDIEIDIQYRKKIVETANSK